MAPLTSTHHDKKRRKTGIYSPSDTPLARAGSMKCAGQTAMSPSLGSRASRATRPHTCASLASLVGSPHPRPSRPPRPPCALFGRQPPAGRRISSHDPAAPGGRLPCRAPRFETGGRRAAQEQGRAASTPGLRGLSPRPCIGGAQNPANLVWRKPNDRGRTPSLWSPLSGGGSGPVSSPSP